jgi:hypothetical protein
MVETRAEATNVEAQFTARIDKIRARVALKLADGVQQTDAALSRMTGDGSDAVNAVATAYRWFHDLSGIGPPLGFEATGKQARTCADMLVDPFRARRGLSADELTVLAAGLQSLRTVALNETHSTEPNQRSVP